MLNIKRDIQSLSTFKRNTNELLEQMKQTGEPIILTVNGKAELVVQDATSYQKLLEQIEKLEIIAGVRKGLKDIEAGRTNSLEEFRQQIQRKYDIPSPDNQSGGSSD